MKKQKSLRLRRRDGHTRQHPYSRSQDDDEDAKIGEIWIQQQQGNTPPSHGIVSAAFPNHGDDGPVGHYGGDILGRKTLIMLGEYLVLGVLVDILSALIVFKNFFVQCILLLDILDQNCLLALKKSATICFMMMVMIMMR